MYSHCSRHAKPDQGDIQVSFGEGIENGDDIVDRKQGDEKPPNGEKYTFWMFEDKETSNNQPCDADKANEIWKCKKIGRIGKYIFGS